MEGCRVRRFSVKTGAVALLASACFLLYFVWNFRSDEPDAGVLYQEIQQNSLPNGALIFRRGTGTEAGAVAIVERGGLWSHVGLIASGPNGVTVIHAVPAEEDGKPDVVKEDSLEYFLAKGRATHAAVMLVKGVGEKEAETAVKAARRMIGMPFGIHPDAAETKGEIYCTTLVETAWKTVGITLTDKRDNIHMPFLGGSYLLPDTLAASNLLIPVNHVSH